MDEFLQILIQADVALKDSFNFYLGQNSHEQVPSNTPSIFTENNSKYPTLPFTCASSDCQIGILDKINQSSYLESNDSKINNIKMNSVSSRRKDELFKRYRKQQEQKIVCRRKQLESLYAFNEGQLRESGEFNLRRGEKNQIFTIKAEDFQKLRLETDLNDTIIDNYLKILRISIINWDIEHKTHIFSSFFMGKLLGDQIRDDAPPQKQTQQMVDRVQKKVCQLYSSVKRWTRKIDIFSKQYLIIPIIAYKHWNCMIVVSPHLLETEPDLCKIIYLDSMFEKKIIFSEAIKTYLELEMEERKGRIINLEQMETYQLLVPRQTNTHDCGLYTLCFIQFFLRNPFILELNFKKIQNRIQLNIFPRSIIFTMRQCLRKLFMGLLVEDNKDRVIENYLKLRDNIWNTSIHDVDYDRIDEREFKKYYRIHNQLGEEKKNNQQQGQYLCKLKFYLDCEINHYEKDSFL